MYSSKLYKDYSKRYILIKQTNKKKRKMKKVIAIFALAFVVMSCGSQSSTESVNDSTAVANDTATVAVDSAAVSSDSTEAVK